MATQLSYFSPVVGISLQLAGIGFIVLALGPQHLRTRRHGPGQARATD